MKGVFRLHDVHAGAQACRGNVAALGGQKIAALLHTPFNGSGDALVAAACESGKVEGAGDVLADGTFGKPLYEGMPTLGKGCLADVVECVPDVVATSQHTAQDKVARDGRIVLVKDVLAARHVGEVAVSHVCKYLINTLK